MKLASYEWNGRATYGALSADGVMLGDMATPEAPTLRRALAAWGMHGLIERARTAPAAAPVEDVRWLQPITDPDKILCVGFNYRAHLAETAQALPPYPSIFVRFPGAQVGQGEPTVRPFASTMFDYEAELAVVIGLPCRHLPEDEAMSVVAGYSCFAENSVRDYQKHAAQATPGKNFEASGAFGPWLVTADEIPDPTRLEVIGRLNGTEMQHASVSQLIFGIPQLIAYCSTFTRLLPGDVIVTGTPAGIGSTRKPPVFMKDGDVFEVEIPGVGLLKNAVVDEAR